MLVSSTDNVYTAGDICSFHDPQLDRRRLCVGWEHAQTTGRIAGENMTGGSKEYTHQAAFQSGYGYRSWLTGAGECYIGDPKGRGEENRAVVVAVEGGEGSAEGSSGSEGGDSDTRAVVFYVDKKTDRLVGTLLYNVFGGALLMARRMLADKLTPKPEEYADLAKVCMWAAAAEDADDEEEGEKVKDEGVGAAKKE
jgi:NADPH-dependent 2,4-dienoyl-CoA reductase/sulfur reductase-like enzyme